ncbi:MAG: hypothetical protein ACXQTV_02910 [Candidatus Hecatellaceae archaeon]
MGLWQASTILKALRPLLVTVAILGLGAALVWLGFGSFEAFAFSGEAPWNIVFTLFTHLSLEHLSLNLKGLTAFTILAVFTILTFSLLTGKAEATRFLAWGYVASAFLPHIVILGFQGFCSPKTAFYGMSLAVFGVYGYSLALSTMSLMVLALRLASGLRGEAQPLAKPLTAVLALLVFLAVLWPIFEAGSLEKLLGAGIKGVNVPGHFYALIGGMIIGVVFASFSKKFNFA